MRIRAYTEGDLEALKRLHRKQGFGYELPELGNPLFVDKLVVEDEGGAVVMALLSRLTSECYLLHDRDAGTPKDRWRAFVTLHEAMRERSRGRGLEDVYVWLPPALAPKDGKERAFQRKLKRLGWCANEWKCYWRNLDPS